MTIDPTARQLEIHAYMLEYHGLRGTPPTLREICDRFGFGSTNAATDHLKSMIVKGIVRKCDGRKGARGTRCYVPIAAGPGTRPRATLVVERARWGTEIEIAYAGDSIDAALAALGDRETWQIMRLTLWRSGAALERWERRSIGALFVAFQRLVRPDALAAWKLVGDPVSRVDLARALGRVMS